MLTEAQKTTAEKDLHTYLSEHYSTTIDRATEEQLYFALAELSQKYLYQRIGKCNKKNPKEPDIVICDTNEEGKAKDEIIALWSAIAPRRISHLVPLERTIYIFLYERLRTSSFSSYPRSIPFPPSTA